MRTYLEPVRVRPPRHFANFWTQRKVALILHAVQQQEWTVTRRAPVQLPLLPHVPQDAIKRRDANPTCGARSTQRTAQPATKRTSFS